MRFIENGIYRYGERFKNVNVITNIFSCTLYRLFTDLKISLMHKCTSNNNTHTKAEGYRQKELMIEENMEKYGYNKNKLQI